MDKAIPNVFIFAAMNYRVLGREFDFLIILNVFVFFFVFFPKDINFRNLQVFIFWQYFFFELSSKENNKRARNNKKLLCFQKQMQEYFLK